MDTPTLLGRESQRSLRGYAYYKCRVCGAVFASPGHKVDDAEQALDLLFDVESGGEYQDGTPPLLVSHACFHPANPKIVMMALADFVGVGVSIGEVRDEAEI